MATIIPYCKKHMIYGRCFLCEADAREVPVRAKRKPEADDDGFLHEMTDEQHRALAAALLELKGAVIVSGYPSPLYEELFAGWQRVERRALADGAAERTEVLWLRNVTLGLFG